ncbi:hypothetical protein BKI52_09500 [marine bacterium AO1-C]|nr:hypothetical protein BKI52_09500 [marine bacterium AO1-C]
MKQTRFNKQLILDFYGRIIGQRDIDYAHKIVAEDYIQHNPFIKSGKVGLIEILEQLKQIPPEPATKANNTLWMMSEGSLVGTYLKVDFMGKKQIVMDLFRIEQGMIVEHWDAIQEVNEQTFVEIPTVPVVENGLQEWDTAKNKGKVATYLQEVWQKQQYHHLDEFVSSDIIFHVPTLGKGYDELREYQQQRLLQKVHLVIAEGNFVMVQCSAVIQGEPHVLYVIYRLEQGKIVESWQVYQPIPMQMVHANGMI